MLNIGWNSFLGWTIWGIRFGVQSSRPKPIRTLASGPVQPAVQTRLRLSKEQEDALLEHYFVHKKQESMLTKERERLRQAVVVKSS